MTEIKEKIVDKKEAIFAATLDLVTKNGFEGTPMSMISEVAGVGAGTIYRYFKSKEDLLNELFRSLRMKMNNVLMLSFGDNKTGFDLFKKLYLNLIHYYMNHPSEFHFLEKFSNSSFITTETLDESAINLEPIAVFFTQNTGYSRKKLDIKILFAFIYGPMIAIMNLQLMGKVKLSDGVIEQCADITWHAIMEK